MDINEAEARLTAIADEVSANIRNIQSEEDSKIQIINRVLCDVLNWPYTAFRAERRHDTGFSDYLLYIGDTPALLLEAKRLGLIEIESAEKNKARNLKISGSSMKRAVAGIEQAALYAAPNGLPIAVLTDGNTWVVFKTFTPGASYKSKEAIVFPSLQAVIHDFSLFYDLLERTQFSKRLYNRIFDDVHNSRLLLTQRLFAPLEENEILLSPKSSMAFDLENVFAAFFSRLAGDDDEDLLIECFVESRESRIADFSLEKITTTVLGNIVPADKSVDAELASLIASNVDGESSVTESGQTIFIVGPTGAGKSTFLDRFFRKTLPNVVRKQCVLLDVNLLDASGQEANVLGWLTERLITNIEREVYEEGAPSYQELVGLYYADYERRRRGVDAHLYSKSKEEFKIKFGDFLDRKVESDREGYLNRLLHDVVKNRKLLPIIVIDNTDEFPLSYKEKLFQFVQSLQRGAKHCLVIFPVTDKSAWSFSKTDIFAIYQSRSFFLPTPSPREVFRKRIQFLNTRILDEKSGKARKAQYFLSKGICISIQDLEHFAKVLESVFVDHDFTSKTIGELTNYNIRRSLVLSQRVITSSVIKIDDLIKAYVGGNMPTANFNVFLDALMKGNYAAFKKGDNPEIYPVFQVDSEVRQSPLLKLRILALLSAARGAGRSVEERHVPVQSIVDYFDALGCPEVAIERALLSLLEGGLIEPFDISELKLTNEQRLAISYRGVAHLRLASSNSVFFYQMAITTPISSEERADLIRSAYDRTGLFTERTQEIRGLFLEFLLDEDRRHLQIDSVGDQYLCQRKLLNDLIGFSRTPGSHTDELVAALGEEYREGSVRTRVAGVVDFFDSIKGFGFVELEGVDDGAYINASKLKEHGVDGLRDGDKILCDVARGAKGLRIERIHSVDKGDDVEVVSCSVIKLLADRGYGFVRLEDGRRDAFFHISVFDEETKDMIRVGDRFRAEVCSDRKGKGLQVRQVLGIPQRGRDQD